ncbi:MAG: molybdopterin molybdotransferase MoeA [Hyphomicrobiales bacterium]|nr:molybdopterin molybdotransferase MoeA [Novosphingobium sp.]MCC2097322.1 molybdopterin molybdotransferase MoeA [Hyphomicrobiales bacterium]
MTLHSKVSISHCGCDDSRHLEGILDVEHAIAIARSLVAPTGETESVPLETACGRIAALDVHAPRPMPFFNLSAMDGFAVRLADLTGHGPWRLAVSATVAAGDVVSGVRREEGSACRIYTGGPLPTGADAVVMNEDCTDEGAFVVISRRPQSGENIRVKGGDIKQGALLVAAGTRIEPRHIGLMAANGLGTLDVFRRPRIAVFSTGRELLSQAAPEEGRVFDANRPLLITMAQDAGAEISDLGIVDDDLEAASRFFASNAGGFDLLLSSGAVSAGGRDFIRPAFVGAGGTVRAWKVALKPGKPVLFGTLGRTAYFGLPGNPLAAYVGFELFVREQLLRLGGEKVQEPHERRAIAGYAVRRKTGRREYVPARIVSWSPAGLPVVETLGKGSSGTLYALAQADGLAVIAADWAQIEPGDPIGFRPFNPLRADRRDGELD